MAVYKNTTGHQISATFYGVGKVTIEANAKAIELEPYIAEAFNNLTFPTVVLEEVEPTIKKEQVIAEVEQEVKETPKPATKKPTPKK